MVVDVTTTPYRYIQWNATTAGAGEPAIIYEIKYYSNKTYAPTVEDFLNLSSPSPTNGANFNISTININLSANSTYPFNCSLYKNNTLNITTVFSAGNNVLVNWSRTFTDGSHTYQVNCTQGNDTTQNQSLAVITFNIDTTPPVITANYTGYYTLIQPLSINSYDIHNANLTATDGCNLSYYNSTQTTANYTRNLSLDLTNCALGSHDAYYRACDTFENCRDTTYPFNSMAQLQVTAHSGITNQTISNFTVTINGTSANTTTGVYTLSNLTAGLLNISIDPYGYSLGYANTTINGTTNQQNFSLYTTNSLLIHIIGEDTGTAILQNVSIQFTTTSSSNQYSTNNGTFYIDNLNATTYTLVFSNANYTSRTYTVTVGDRTFQQLNAFLAPGTGGTTIFTVMNKDTMELLFPVYITQYTLLNGSWQPVESKYSDITGRAQFSYIALVQYKFFLSFDGYDDYVFYLNPVLFSSYDIRMTQQSQINYTQDYDQIGLIYAPQAFPNNNKTAFNFIIAMPSGGLVNYGINLTYPGGTNGSAGSNAIGEQLSVNIRPVNATALDYVVLKYYYYTTLSGYRNFTVSFPITYNMGAGDNSMMSMEGNTFGMTVFERVLIATVIMIAIAGLAALMGQALAGIAVAVTIMAFFTYVGFIPLWLVLPSGFILVLMIIWKAGG